MENNSKPNIGSDLQQVIHGTTSARPTEAILGTGYELLIDSASTGGAYELMKFVVPSRLGPPRHMHTREDEHYLFLSGTFEVTVGDSMVEATQGTFLHLPKNIPHSLLNTGTTEGSFLCWVIPGNLGECFAQFKKPWPADQKFPPVLTRDDIQRMVETAKKYGIESMI